MSGQDNITRSGDPRRIAVIRFSSAGDILLAAPALRGLRRQFPTAQITFITLSPFASLAERLPGVDQVVTAERDWDRQGLVAWSRELVREKGRFDLVVDLHASLRSRLVRRRLGARRLVLRKPTLRKWLLVRTGINLLRPAVPIPLRYLRTLAPLGVTDDGAGLGFGDPLTAGSDRRGERTVALAPGARHATKRWPAERFAALGRELVARHGARLLLLGGSEEVELCREIAGEIGGSAISLAGETTFPEAADLLDQCDVVVANDSALAHLALARGRPVVVLFGSSVEELGFAPFRGRSELIEVTGLACRPCSTVGRERCPQGHFRCMLEIGVERVIEAVVRLAGWEQPPAETTKGLR